MMVPVPAFQHSPMLGHLASSQTVARRCSRTTFLTAVNPSPPGARARSQGGLRVEAGGGVAVARLDAVPDGRKALGRNIFLAAPGVGALLNDRNTFELWHGRHCTVYRDRRPRSQGRETAVPSIGRRRVADGQGPLDLEARAAGPPNKDPAAGLERGRNDVDGVVERQAVPLRQLPRPVVHLLGQRPRPRTCQRTRPRSGRPARAR